LELPPDPEKSPCIECSNKCVKCCRQYYCCCICKKGDCCCYYFPEEEWDTQDNKWDNVICCFLKKINCCFYEAVEDNAKRPNWNPILWMLPMFAGYDESVFLWETWMLLRRTLILAVGTIWAENALYRGQALIIVNGFILFTHIWAQPFRHNPINRMESLSLVILIVLSTLVLEAPPVLPVANALTVLLATVFTFIIIAFYTVVFERLQVYRNFLFIGSLFRWNCWQTRCNGYFHWCCRCKLILDLNEEEKEETLKRKHEKKQEMKRAQEIKLQAANTENTLRQAHEYSMTQNENENSPDIQEIGTQSSEGLCCCCFTKKTTTTTITTDKKNRFKNNRFYSFKRYVNSPASSFNESFST